MEEEHNKYECLSFQSAWPFYIGKRHLMFSFPQSKMQRVNTWFCGLNSALYMSYREVARQQSLAI